MKPICLPTASAHWGWDEHRYFGFGVFAELAGRESLTGLTALSVLGRRLSADACAVLDDAAVCLSMADPRIWPLKLTRVIAAHGGTTAALAAGLLIEENARIGPWTCAKSAELLASLHLQRQGSALASEAVDALVRSSLAKHRFVSGFGTPYRKRDERLLAFWQCLERRGRRQLPYQQTLDALIAGMARHRQIAPNMGIGVAAALLDLGVQVSEVGPLATALMQHMFFAHAVEGARQAPEQLQRLPDERIHYIGRGARSSPKALAASADDPRRVPASDADAEPAPLQG